MASSEIEVVSSESKTQSEQSPNNNAPTVIDVFSASAYGDFEKLRKFVEQDGASLSKPDGNGYYALQWAALNNFADIAQYIIEVVYPTILFLFFFPFPIEVCNTFPESLLVFIVLFDT